MTKWFLVRVEDAEDCGERSGSTNITIECKLMFWYRTKADNSRHYLHCDVAKLSEEQKDALKALISIEDGNGG